MSALLNFVLEGDGPKLCLSGTHSPKTYLSMGAYASLDTIVIGALYPC